MTMREADRTGGARGRRGCSDFSATIRSLLPLGGLGRDPSSAAGGGCGKRRRPWWRRRADSTKGTRPAAARRRPAGRRWPPSSRHRALDPLEREIGSAGRSRTVSPSARRIPIGMVGANFEARPNVALDVAGQLLKSGTRSCCAPARGVGTVTVLVDHVFRPALEESGLPPRAVGLVRAAEREGAECSSRFRAAARDPPRQRRDDGRARRDAAANGVRTLAHAEGGGVLYLARGGDPAMAERWSREPRPARRLQPAQPRARRRRGPRRRRGGGELGARRGEGAAR